MLYYITVCQNGEDAPKPILGPFQYMDDAFSCRADVINEMRALHLDDAFEYQVKELSLDNFNQDRRPPPGWYYDDGVLRKKEMILG